jgi:hypothetical protein
MLKMYTKDGIWIVEDKGVNKCFDSAYDAWAFVLLLKGIRPKVPYIRPWEVVKSLVPNTERRIKNVRIHT